MGALSDLASILFSPIKALFDWMTPDIPEQQTGTLTTKASSDDPLKVVYGRRMIAGTIVFMNTNDADNDDVKNDLLHLVIAWSEPVTEIEQIWLGDYEITDSRYDDKDGRRWAYANNFIDGMTGYNDPLLRQAGWDPIYKKHVLQGTACSYIRLEWSIDDDAPFTGIPNIKAVVKGAKVKNLAANSNNKQYSTNPAECLYDYLTHPRYGKGENPANIDIASFSRGARICNTQVPVSQGSSDKKFLFTTNIALDTAGTRVLDNVNALLKTMRATLPVIDGKLTLVIEQDDAPVNAPILQNMIRGALKHKESGVSKRFNSVIVEFADADQKWSTQQAIYPEPDSDLAKQWLSEDNNQVLDTRFKVNAITDYYEARQMARVIAMLSRESYTLEIEVCPRAIQYTHGDVIPVHHEKLGLAGKPFRLMHIEMLNDGWFKLRLREHQPYIYNWLNGNVRPPIPDTILPDPRKVQPVENFTIHTQDDGKILIKWQSPHTQFDIQIHKGERHLSSHSSTLPQFLISTLSSGSYEIDVRARSALGYNSAWAKISFEVTRPTKPTITTLSKTHDTITLSASVNNAGIGTQFEWQFAGEGTQKKVIGAQLTMAGLLPATEYSGQCRTINVTGKSQWQTFNIKTKALSASERVTGLVFELSQSPTWLSLGDTWHPATLEQKCAVVLNDAKSQTQLARRSFNVNLDSENGLLNAQLNDDATNDSGEPLLITFDGQGTPNLTATATHGLLVQRQQFSVTGVNLQDIKDIKADINEMDALAESVLEQALDSENVFDADLKSTLHLEQKTDNTNAVIVEVAAAQAKENEAIATKITKLTSTVDENHSEIETYFITKVDANKAISQAKTVLESKVNDNRAYLDQTFYTKTSTDEAISAANTRLETGMGERIGAVNDALSVVKSDVEGNNSALNTLTLRANSIAGSVWAVNNRVDTAQTDANNNSRAISALNLRAENIEQGVNANASQISDVKTTAEGAATATQNLATRVRNSEDQISSAYLTLQSHAGTLNELGARAELGVDENGTVTGMTITPGKIRFKSGAFELLDDYQNRVVYFDPSTRRYVFQGVIKATSAAFSNTVQFYAGAKFKNSGYGQVTVNSSSIQFYDRTLTLTASLSINGSAKFISVSSDSLFSKKVVTEHLGLNSTRIAAQIKSTTSTGIDVSGVGWAVYARKGEIGPHTSAHETLLPKELTPAAGDILCDDELMHIADISNAICTAKLSSSPMDVTARGIFTRRRTLTDEQPAGLKGFEEWEQLAYLYDIASINAGGEGAMNVCGEGGNLQTGDLICSSSMLGKGMRQPTQSEERYTVAQVRHNVTFDSPDQVKQVAVIYKRG
jgi:hypothetical protein